MGNGIYFVVIFLFFVITMCVCNCKKNIKKPPYFVIGNAFFFLSISR